MYLAWQNDGIEISGVVWGWYLIMTWFKMLSYRDCELVMTAFGTFPTCNFKKT
jgi:hypothetical protein